MIEERSTALEVPGATLHLCEVGPRGARPLVALHGGPGEAHDVLRPHLDRLASPARRVVYYDQRGGGRSALRPGVGPGGFREHVEDVDRVRMHLGGGAIDLLGFSWGARIALRYACEHPTRVRTLVLVSPPAPPGSIDRAALAAAAARPEVREIVARVERDAQSRPDLAPLARFVARIAPALHDPARVLELRPVEVDPECARAAEVSMEDGDPTQLDAVAWRALVVFGRHDPISAPAAGDLARRIGAKLVALDCGHAPFVESREAFLAAVSESLEST